VEPNDQVNLLLLAHHSVQAQAQQWQASNQTLHQRQETNKIWLSVSAQFIQCTQTLISWL
jgi:hypothetical protein